MVLIAQSTPRDEVKSEMCYFSNFKIIVNHQADSVPVLKHTLESANYTAT